jgi:signal transduction histidine kinase
MNSRLAVPGVLAAALLVGMLSVLVSLSEIGHPFIGAIVTSDGASGWKVDNGTPPWWPAMGQGGLTHRDALLGASGQPIASADLARTAAGRDSLAITVRRDGQMLVLDVPVSPFTLGHVLDLRAIEILNGLTLWLIGALIYAVRRDDALNRAAALACGIFSMNQWLWHGAVLDVAAPGGLVLVTAWSLVTPFVGPALLGFGLRFAHAEPSAPLPRLAWFTQMLMWFAAIALVSVSAIVALVPALAADWQFALYRANVLMSFSGAFAVLALLAASLALSPAGAYSRVRNQRVMIAAGFVIALPALVTHFVILWRGYGSFFVLGGLDVRTLYLAVPIALSVAILRYQTFKSESTAQLVLANMAASGALASLGDWLIRLLSPAQTAFVLPPFLIVFALVFVLMLLIEALRRRGLRRIFRWQSTSTRAAMHFGERLAGAAEQDALPGQIVSTLIDELRLECAAVWLRDTSDASNRQSDWADCQLGAAAPREWRAPALAAVLDPHVLAAALELPGQPIRLHNNPSGLEAIVALSGVELQHPAGFLALGKRNDEEIFHEADFEIIELIAQQTALLLANARKVSSLRAVPARLAEAQERERFRIAQELHDTIQQFLGRLPFQLEAGRLLIGTQPAVAEARLAQLMVDVQQAAHTVREIRADLAPAPLNAGLREPLQALLARFEARTGLALTSDISSEIDSALSLAARHALFRVFQQALDNIEAHAHARTVTVMLRCDAAQALVHFAITDDGDGISESRRAAAEAVGQLGLRSMHARIVALGGALSVAAAAPKGTRVEGSLKAI